MMADTLAVRLAALKAGQLDDWVLWSVALTAAVKVAWMAHPMVSLMGGLQVGRMAGYSDFLQVGKMVGLRDEV